MKCVRVYDTAPDELAPGEVTKRRMQDSHATYDVWWVCTPNGLVGRLSAPEDRSRGHHRVTEHDDTIDVPRPGAGEPANSIMVTGWPIDGGERKPGEPLMSWHGYIVDGEWVGV